MSQMMNVQEVDATALQERLNNGEKIRLVDVRSEAEFAQGMIEGGELLPLHLLPVRMNEFSNDETLVFYCRSGARSAQACMYLKQHTGVDALNLRGGIIAWYQVGNKISLPKAS